MNENRNRRLVPWIKRNLDQNTFRGFRWISRRKKLFQLPWHHKSSRKWNESDIAVPKAWALFKGRSGDPKKYKSNFRCALNSRREFVELKRMRNKRYHFWMILENQNDITTANVATNMPKPRRRPRPSKNRRQKAQETTESSRTHSNRISDEKPLVIKSEGTISSPTGTSSLEGTVPLPSFEFLHYPFTPSPYEEADTKGIATVPFDTSFTVPKNSVRQPSSTTFPHNLLDFCPPTPPEENDKSREMFFPESFINIPDVMSETSANCGKEFSSLNPVWVPGTIHRPGISLCNSSILPIPPVSQRMTSQITDEKLSHVAPAPSGAFAVDFTLESLLNISDNMDSNGNLSFFDDTSKINSIDATYQKQGNSMPSVTSSSTNDATVMENDCLLSTILQDLYDIGYL